MLTAENRKFYLFPFLKNYFGLMKLFNSTHQRFNDTTIQTNEFHYYKPYLPENKGYKEKNRIHFQEVDGYTKSCNSYLVGNSDRWRRRYTYKITKLSPILSHFTAIT